jgi:hypothetical protein
MGMDKPGMSTGLLLLASSESVGLLEICPVLRVRYRSCKMQARLTVPRPA